MQKYIICSLKRYMQINIIDKVWFPIQTIYQGWGKQYKFFKEKERKKKKNRFTKS